QAPAARPRRQPVGRQPGYGIRRFERSRIMMQFVRRRSRWFLLAVMCCALAGCAGKKKAVALQEQNRALGQQVLNLQKENEELTARLTSAVDAQQRAEQALLDERNRALANMRPRRDA